MEYWGRAWAVLLDAAMHVYTEENLSIWQLFAADRCNC